MRFSNNQTRGAVIVLAVILLVSAIRACV